MKKLTHKNVPDDGVIKYTEGCYIQVFDKDGNLINSQFIAGGSCEYLDQTGNTLDGERSNFYYSPFDTGEKTSAII